MAGRQLCQWDKDSCSDAGFLKIDLLGLGMLSAVEDCVEKIAEIYGAPIDLSRIPLDDRRRVRGDPAGRHGRHVPDREPGPDAEPPAHEAGDDRRSHGAGRARAAGTDPGQGGAPVHRAPAAAARGSRRSSTRSTTRHCGSRSHSTLGVVVFQDQVLDVAIALAGFTVGEAEGLRRAMSRKRSRDALESHRVRFVEGAVANGVDEKVADLVYDKLVGFSGFGFPKSHAAAFGLLAYQSQWLRHHYPAEFLCSLLNAQPMGFYPPASLVRDAQRRGVEVLSPDVNLSESLVLAHSARRRAETLVAQSHKVLPQAVRIGLAYVQSVGEDDAAALVAEREANGPYRDVGDLARRVAALEGRARGARRGRRLRLLRARERRDLLWELGLAARPASVPGTQGMAKQLTLSLDPTAATPALRDLTRWELMAADYRRTGLSVGTHPLDAAPPASARRNAREVTSCTVRRTDLPLPTPALRSRASGRPRRRGSCSCCSRTSTAR